MENLKRYGPFNCPECGGCMTEESVGEYVKFSDIKDILKTPTNNHSDVIASMEKGATSYMQCGYPGVGTQIREWARQLRTCG